MTEGPILEIVGPYLEKVKASGPRNVMALCPFHSEERASFAINIETGAWMCHGCGQRGSLVDFLSAVGMPRSKIDVEIEPLHEWLEKHRKKQEREVRHRFQGRNPFIGEYALPESLLGMFDFKPMDLVRAGFDPKLLRELGVGYDQKKDRIIFPLRDLYGNLVGVSGRTTRGAIPRYLIYSGRRKVDGKVRPGDFGKLFDENFPKYEINKSRYLWNAHRVLPAVTHSPDPVELIVVEGYKACIWMIQHGYPNTVALMGSSISRTQVDLICHMAESVTLFLDGNDAGLRGAYRIGSWLKRSMSVRVCSYGPLSEQPDDLNSHGLDRAMSGRLRFPLWLRRERNSEWLIEEVERRKSRRESARRARRSSAA